MCSKAAIQAFASFLTLKQFRSKLSLILRLHKDFEMKISYKWLKEYANVSLPPVEVPPILTDCGLEVEGIEEF